MTSKIFGNDHYGLNEDLVLCLMDWMPNKVLVNFVQTCRALYKLAKPIMKEREREFIATYEEIHMDSEMVYHAVQVLQEDITAAKYVRKIVYRGTNPHDRKQNLFAKVLCAKEDYVSIENYPLAVDDITRFTSPSAIMGDARWQTVVRSLRQFSRRLLNILLVCTNLRSLNYDDDILGLLHCLKTILVCNCEISLHNIHHRTSMRLPSLSNLTRLELSYSGPPKSIAPSEIEILMSLLSLREIHFGTGWYAGAKDWDNQYRLSRIFSSNVECIVFCNGEIQAEAVLELMSWSATVCRLQIGDIFRKDCQMCFGGHCWHEPISYDLDLRFDQLRAVLKPTLEARGFSMSRGIEGSGVFVLVEREIPWKMPDPGP